MLAQSSRINIFREISVQVYRVWKNIYIFEKGEKNSPILKSFQKKKKKKLDWKIRSRREERYQWNSNYDEVCKKLGWTRPHEI